jgi:hypothetical protein
MGKWHRVVYNPAKSIKPNKKDILYYKTQKFKKHLYFVTTKGLENITN